MNSHEQIKERLLAVLGEIKQQVQLSSYFGGESLSFDEEMEQIREYLEDAGEFGIAYEVLVANLEQVPFMISGRAAISLLEVALLLGYKTDREQDWIYDRRMIR
ncbi:MAG: hypothetical protein RLZZ436_904 [Planctomycetota bacterium]|jgi:hypothetical protein